MDKIQSIDDLTQGYTPSESKYIIWKKEIENAKHYCKEYHSMAKNYDKTYQNKTTESGYSSNITSGLLETMDSFNGSSERFNIFYSNIETLKPLLFSNLPVPEIRRRNIKQDYISGIVSTLLERAASCTLEKENADNKIEKARDDFLIVKRGVVRVGFEQEIITEEQEQEVVTDTGEIIIEKNKTEQAGEKKVTLDYVPWDDLLIQPAKQWQDVDWIAFRHELTEKEFIEKFGKRKLKNINFDKTRSNDIGLQGLNASQKNSIFSTCEIWEIWDKVNKKVVFLSESTDDNSIIKEVEDQYGFDDFWCIPKPLGIDSGRSSINPIPDYVQYQAQAEEINRISNRITALIEQINVSGLYNKRLDENSIQSFLSNIDGKFSPVELSSGERIQDNVFYKDIMPIVNALVPLYQQRKDALQIVAQLSGISDIVRGSTNANETARAQQLKGNFAISRIQPQQKEIQVFCRDLVRLISQLYCANWSVEELSYIAGMEIIDIENIKQNITLTITQSISQNIDRSQMPEGAEQQINQEVTQAVEQQIAPLKKLISEGKAIDVKAIDKIQEILQNDTLREYRIDIETDSTIQIDKERRQQGAMEIINTVADTANKLLPLVQNGGLSMKAYKSLLGYTLKQLGSIEEVENIILDEEEEDKPSKLEIARQNQAEQEKQDRMVQLQIQEREVAVKEDKNQVDREKISANMEINQVNAQKDLELQQGQATRDFILQNEKTKSEMESNLENQF